MESFLDKKLENMSNFAEKLVIWYQANKRLLPWRDSQNPYFIWLSEVILQQTRVAQGLPYYLRFVEHFPTVQALAKAEESQILRLWQGLGYYSRARNLHTTAKTVSEKYKGVFPTQYAELLKLKGIGTYTAAAIASFSTGEKVAVLDGNVFRVLARNFGIFEDILSGKAKKIFTETAQELLPEGNSTEYNQAIMEFGALHCKPANPDCENCIFQVSCYAFAHKKQQELPVKIKKTKIRHRQFDYLIWEHEDKVLMKIREGKDIWQGLYDFDLIENTDFLETDFGKKMEIKSISPTFAHSLTHQILNVRFVRLEIKEKAFFEQIKQEKGLQIFQRKELDALPKPILIANYLANHFF